MQSGRLKGPSGDQFDILKVEPQLNHLKMEDSDGIDYGIEDMVDSVEQDYTFEETTRESNRRFENEGQHKLVH